MKQKIGRSARAAMLCLALIALFMPGAGAQSGAPAHITLGFGGDCTLSGRRLDKTYQEMGCAYFFAHLAPLFAEDDWTTVNLEGPLTTATAKRPGRQFNFKGKPEYAQILSQAGIDAVTLANNHFRDYKARGQKDTMRALKEAGVDYFVNATVLEKEIKGARIGFLGFTQWDAPRAYVKKAVAQLKKRCDIVVVNFHWGVEKRGAATTAQKKLGRLAVDAGADLVIGHHPHVVGGVQVYKGKRIVYSLGNLCFGGSDAPYQWEAIIFRQTFSFDPATRAVTIVQDQIVPIRISGNTDRNDFAPLPLEGSEAAAVMGRIQALSKDFAQTLDFAALQMALDQAAAANQINPPQ